MSQPTSDRQSPATSPQRDVSGAAHRLLSDAVPRSGRPQSWLVRKAGLDLPTTPWRRYGIAAIAIVCALLLRYLFDPIMQGRGSYGFFLIATAFVAWRCGTVPALFTTIGGVVFGTLLFEDPRGSFSAASSGSNVALTVSLLIGIATAIFCGSLRHTAMENARLYRHAREADARKDEFLAMLAHELRNPLTPLKNALYLLDACGPHEKEAAELHAMMSGQLEHLVRLVDDLLDVSRITQGKIELKWERVETGRLVEDVLQAVRPTLIERGHDLRLTLPEQNTYLQGDRVRLTQIFINLLNNAVKYTPPSGRIWFSVETGGDELIFRVRDTGIGLSQAEIARIFDLFEQAGHAQDLAKGGLGIGLTLVRRLVEMQGGKVEATSGGSGLGSEFIVRLPRVAAPEAVAKPTGDALAPPKRVTPTSLRVVIVEDVAATAKSMSTILGLWKHETKTCSDGFTALEVIRTFRPDVVLADLGLPQMSGYQLAEEIRKLPGQQDTVLIAISGYGQPADKERSQAAGFTRHLVKPIDPAELEQILDDLRPAYAKAAGRDA
ncbi:MAG: response regulator [Planctomycetes bacterium]|nr:response regulator [Planctomycetota bacterium]